MAKLTLDQLIERMEKIVESEVEDESLEALTVGAMLPVLTEIRDRLNAIERRQSDIDNRFIGRRHD